MRASFDDPAFVRDQYACEDNLEARRAIYSEITGDDAREIAFAAVAEAVPTRVLEVGCGPGEASARIMRDLGADVVAIDQSERMVELARERGVDARVGDAQALPFEDGAFDCALAAWMLYHVSDLDRGLAELARVLRPGGRLVAVTNGADHLAELWHLVGVERIPLTFGRENGEEALRRHFRSVGVHGADGTVTLADADAVRRYLASSERGKPYVDLVPELDTPLVARRSNVVFVAEKA
jgi:SAM-dependent methyltransferase